MLNGPARNNHMAIPVLPYGVVLQRIVRISFLSIYFFDIQQQIEVAPNHEILVPRGMTSLRQAVGNVMKKYSLHLIFTFYLNQSHIGAGNIPFRCISLKTAFQSVCVDPLTGNWNCRARDRKWRSYQYILLQTRPHIMTINLHNNIQHAFSAPNLSEMCGLSTYWQFFYHRPPVNFWRDR